MLALITEHLGVSIPIIGFAMVITYVAATVQATIGFGFALICVPVLSLVDPALTPVPQLFALTPLTIGMAWRERSHIDLKGVSWVILGRLIGAGLGLKLLSIHSRSMLDAIIGLMVLLAVILAWWRPQFERNRVSEVGAGTLSGMSPLISSIGGPLLALLYRNESGGALRGSMAAVFIIGLTITFGARIASGHIHLQDLWIGLCLIPPVLMGLKTSSSFISLIEGALLKWMILIIAGCSSLLMIIRGLFF